MPPKKNKRTASQVGKMSRRKGKAFECFCARYFTAWTGTKWETTRNSGRTDLKGDIYCVEHPDMNMVIECKHRKAYIVHAMLKPTKAFEDMIDESLAKLRGSQYLIFIVKNETGVWMSNTYVTKNGIKKLSGNMPDPLCMGILSGCYEWYKIQDYCDDFDVEGVHFEDNPTF